MSTQWTEKYYDEVDGKAIIKAESFPELQVDFDTKTGTPEKFHTRQEARIMFAQALRRHGYRPIGNRTWVYDGVAAVIVP